MTRLVNVPIEKLTPGMFVQSVLKQKGSMQVKTKGVVSSEDVVAALRSRGLTLFQVDLSKSKLAEEEKESAQSESIEPPPVDTKQLSNVSFENEINKAAKLYDDAK